MFPRRILSLFLTAVATASAATLPYQGILTDDKGVPVTDGEKSFEFAVYGQSTGGAALWSETRTLGTHKGLFSLSLGTVTPLPDALFSRDSLFLNVTVAGKDLLPRTPLAAAPWAFRAHSADFAKTVAGLDAKADTSALNTVKTSLAGYATTSALNAGLGAKVDTATLAAYARTAALAGYATTAALSSGLGGKVDTSAFNTRLSGYATKASLANYATTSDLSSYANLSAVSALDTRTATLESYYQPSKWKTAVGTPAGSMEYQFSLNMNTGLNLSQYMVSSATRTQIANFRNGWVEFYEDTKVGGDLTVVGSASIGTSLTVGTSIKVAGVTMAVPDYVFEPDYRLAPLSEVEAYVTTNKHLPEIPSAKEIEAGGIDLAQMNLLLLKKVEELTLHAIAQEKRIQALEERLK